MEIEDLNINLDKLETFSSNSGSMKTHVSTNSTTSKQSQNDATSQTSSISAVNAEDTTQRYYKELRNSLKTCILSAKKPNV